MIPAIAQGRVPASSADFLAAIRKLEAHVAEQPQVDIATHHVLHGGMYARTICIPAGVVLTGAQIKVATMLIVSGHVRVTVGNDVSDIAGYHVLAASAHRKQAFLAIEDTQLTMLFPTSAATVEDAEREFTDEHDKLFSRAGRNSVLITGE